ncbi:hypothetical protein BST61_g10343 [Cercospora zeina]
MLTGRLRHALGNIFFALGETERSSSYHTRAMEHYSETVGPTHHRTADMYFKVAQHKYRAGQLDEARNLLDHWKAKVVPAREQSVERRIAADSLRSARTECGVESATFEDSDFDEMVVFWSR